MEKVKIAVSGIGGGAGQSVVKALYETDYEIVGLDGEQYATGLYAVPTGYVIPYANSPEYVPTLLDILKKENCRLMFPGLDAELPVLAAQREAFQKEGITLVVSSPEVVEIADDKQLTADLLQELGMAAPVTHILSEVLNGAASLPYPYIVKPKTGGARSKNVYVIKNIDNIKNLAHICPDDFVAQEYIEGDEYTCGSVSFEGECFGVIVMRRILRDGDTYKAFVEFNPIIEEAVKKIIARLKPFGPFNVQLRMRDGVPYVFELNARCSGTTAARAISGFNEPAIIADYLTKGSRPTLQIKKTNIFRYWKEFVADDEMLENMVKRRYGHHPGFTKL
jgi:carbamoyl-phosphate synthase large subunit